MEEIFDSQREREWMVREQLERRGIRDPRILRAMGRVPRELFVDDQGAGRAYGDHPLPIGYGQTISQPFLVAYRLELLALRGDERVLDVGAGSGYQAAVLSECVPAGRVYAVERIPQLAALAARRLLALRYPVEVICSDGTEGWAAHAPYDAIAVATGAPQVPEPLLAQLADGGRLVMPVGQQQEQRLLLIRRIGNRFEMHPDRACVYLDPRGAYRWQEPGGETAPAQI